MERGMVGAHCGWPQVTSIVATGINPYDTARVTRFGRRAVAHMSQVGSWATDIPVHTHAKRACVSCLLTSLCCVSISCPSLTHAKRACVTCLLTSLCCVSVSCPSLCALGADLEQQRAIFGRVRARRAVRLWHHALRKWR